MDQFSFIYIASQPFLTSRHIFTHQHIVLTEPFLLWDYYQVFFISSPAPSKNFFSPSVFKIPK